MSISIVFTECNTVFVDSCKLTTSLATALRNTLKFAQVYDEHFSEKLVKSDVSEADLEAFISGSGTVLDNSLYRLMQQVLQEYAREARAFAFHNCRTEEQVESFCKVLGM